MTVRFTAQFPTVQFGYVKVEMEGEDQAALFTQFVDAASSVDDYARLLANPDQQGMANLSAGGIQVNPANTYAPAGGPPPWAAPTQDEAQQFIPPYPQQQVPPAGWQSSVPQQAAPAASPKCAHGDRQYRQDKNTNPPKWRAWMCPTPKGTPGQCEPEWIK